MSTKENRNSPFLKSRSVVEDTEELTNLLYSDYLRARENTNIKPYTMQEIKNKYLLGKSIALTLQEYQFYGNTHFELFDMLLDEIRRCKNALEISELTVTFPLSPTRKTIARQILETHINKERVRQ